MIRSIEIPIPQTEDGVLKGCHTNQYGGVTTYRGPSQLGDVDAVITIRLTADQAQTLRHAPPELHGSILAEWLNPDMAEVGQ